ncbi:MAG: isoprenylcysteine carboxylmethyltransferase family protein [Ignavibacteriae bacterium]|nr:isoprenylcysteine carboxylmethyltransferase family protein [Ignavibacteriota bacterium]
MRLAPASFESAVYVMIQFASIIVIFLNVSIVPQNLYLVFGIALFLLIGMRAVFVMKFDFNIAPDVVKGAQLRAEGPYKFIRHPMYTSVLGLTLMYVIDSFTVFNLMMFVILLIDLLMKLNYEEKLLGKRFPEYSEYKKRTKRIIPYIF